jgi:hypothetical protein
MDNGIYIFKKTPEEVVSELNNGILKITDIFLYLEKIPQTTHFPDGSYRVDSESNLITSSLKIEDCKGFASSLRAEAKRIVDLANWIDNQPAKIKTSLEIMAEEQEPFPYGTHPNRPHPPTEPEKKY